MNKLFSKIATLSVGLAMAVGVGVALGRVEVQKAEAVGFNAKYTITSKTAVSKSGTAPAGSTAQFSQTYSTVEQMTSGNSMTLKLSGYTGYKITKVILSMKSNSSKGAGALNVRVGTAAQLSGSGATTIYTMSEAAFNTSAWNGEYSTTYVDIEKTMSVEKHIQENEIVEFKINATANSLYCQSFDVYYESAEVIDITSITAVNLEKASVPSNYGKQITATAVYTESNANEPFVWTSSDTSVATIAESIYGEALITLKGVQGTTTIKAAAKNHSETVFATATLTVTEAVEKHVYDITFVGNGDEDATDSLTTSTIGDALVGDGASLTFSDVTKVYKGANHTIKFSSSKGDGSLTISKVGEGEGDNIKAVIFEAKRYGDKTCLLSAAVGEAEEQSTGNLGDDFKYYHFSFETAAKTVTIQSTERSYIRNLVLIVDGNSAELGAYKTAVSLLNATAEGCSEKSETKLQTAWTTLSTAYGTDKTAFDGMDAFLKEVAPKENGDVCEQALARYKVIIEKYGFTDFIGRGYVKTNVLAYGFNGSSNGIVYITAIIVATTLITTAGLVIILRKKKHN